MCSSSSLACTMLERYYFFKCSPSRTVLSSTPGSVQADSGWCKSDSTVRVRVCCGRPLSFLQDGGGFSIAARRARQWPVQHPMWQCGRTSRDDVSESGGVQRVWSRTAWLDTWCVKLMRRLNTGVLIRRLTGNTRKEDLAISSPGSLLSEHGLGKTRHLP